MAMAVGLLFTAMTANAQYHSDEAFPGVSTSKVVSAPDDDGFYTITLETFATGTTTVTEAAKPADVVLVLDLSTSMRDSRGTRTRVTQRTALSYNNVVSARTVATNYLYNTYQLFAEEYNGRYYLYYNASGSNNKNYVRAQNNGINTTINTTTNRNNASYATRPGDAIVTFPANGVLYTGSSRIFALKEAVCAFIDTINENDLYEKDANDNLIPRDSRLGNKLSIITFESDPVVHQSLQSLADINLDDLKSKVWNFSLRTGTQPSEGIESANTQFSTNGHTGTVDVDFTRTLLIFTDGDPYDNPKYKGVASAYTSKNTYMASVYTVGMFDSSPSSTSDTFKFMNYMSSNYPTASLDSANQMDDGDGGSDQGYYKDASSSSVDLTEIFSAIASASGGSTAQVGASTQVRDVVSNSFVIPEDTEPSDIKVYTANAVNETTWGSRVAFNATVNIVDVDAQGTPVAAGAANAANRAVIVEGFDFSKDDTSEGAGDGNWVGQRYDPSRNPPYFWAGKKLIIEIKIRANGDATGGTGTPTNTETSGVYVYNPDTGAYTCVNHYDIPHTTLTTTIKISKTGLRSGESATFEIMKIRPKGWDETKTVDENVANIQYDIAGRPLPNSTSYTGPETGSDLYKKMGWSSFSKVILTNKGANGAEVIKTMRGLDPYWIYMVLEDDWGWAYTMTGLNQTDASGLTTTSTVDVNPFKFRNTEKADAVKHAEAVTINHFGYTISGGAFNGKQEEHYKSSKVESFTTPGTTPTTPTE